MTIIEINMQYRVLIIKIQPWTVECTWWQFSTFLKLRWILSLQAVSVLNWKNIAHCENKKVPNEINFRYLIKNK